MLRFAVNLKVTGGARRVDVSRKKRLPDRNFQSFHLDVYQSQKSRSRSFEFTFGIASLLGISSSACVNLMDVRCRLDLG